MIEECNFKRKVKKDIHYPLIMRMNKGVYCRLTGIISMDDQMECNGEENCILFQLYKEKEVKK